MKTISRFTVCRLKPLSHFPFKKSITNLKKIYCLMPQLDIVSYFPQFFWFCIFFTFFYITLVQNYLPKITRIFAVREAVQQNNTEDSTSNEFVDLSTKTQHVFSKVCNKQNKIVFNSFKQLKNFLGFKKIL